MSTQQQCVYGLGVVAIATWMLLFGIVIGEKNSAHRLATQRAQSISRTYEAPSAGEHDLRASVSIQDSQGLPSSVVVKSSSRRH